MIANLLESAQHQHKNPNGTLGGWVAETAKVAPSVFVGPYAIIYGQAELTGKVRVLDTAQVSGHAKLSGDVAVYGNCWIDGAFHASTGHFHANAKVQSKQERLRPAEDGL